MDPTFHLSIGVNSISEETNFFSAVLSAKVTHSESSYTNLDVLGVQITLKPIPGITPDLPELHFGFNLSLEKFNEVAASILKYHSRYVAASPTVVDANTVMERKKMYLKSPTGYLVELKGYKETPKFSSTLCSKNIGFKAIENFLIRRLTTDSNLRAPVIFDRGPCYWRV
jgi:extradiol dioxygenase family protein